MTSDARIDRLETEVSQLGQRLAAVEGELRQVGARLTGLEGRINTLLVVTIALWATTIGAILGAALLS